MYRTVAMAKQFAFIKGRLEDTEVSDEATRSS
jgi:hypothetical protein